MDKHDHDLADPASMSEFEMLNLLRLRLIKDGAIDDKKDRRYRNVALKALHVLVSIALVATLGMLIVVIGGFRLWPTPENNTAIVLLDRSELITYSPLKDILDNTQNRFDIFALTANGILECCEASIFEAIKRGVHFRFVLMDPDTHNYTNPFDERNPFNALLISIHEDVQKNRDEAVDVRVRLIHWMQKIADDKRLYRGSLEFRSLSGPLLMGFWIRDPFTNNRLGQLQVYTYRGFTNQMFFKFGSDKDRPISKLADEFEELWARSTPPVSPSTSNVPVGPIGPHRKFQFIQVGEGDCAGNDWNMTLDSAIPSDQYCTPDHEGHIAVCWDNVKQFNSGHPGPWCTYKSKSQNGCSGGGSPGLIYTCTSLMSE